MSRMLSMLLLPLLALAVQASANAPAAAASTHASHAVKAHVPAPAGTRWKADAPLSAGMARVRVATESLAHMPHGHPGPAQVVAVADELRSAVNAMFAQCRLAPAPDAALHPLLARILGASKALRAAPTNPAPVAELKDVLVQYGKSFDERVVPAAAPRR